MPTTLKTVLALFAVISASHASMPCARAQAGGDLDNDGIDDLVVGVEGEKAGSIAAAGAVQMIFGTNNGLRFGTDFIINQNAPGSRDEAEANDRFGRVVALGDFNGDGFADLAVGVPLQDISGADNAGIVQVFYGSADGPDPSTDQIWSQNALGVDDIPEDGDLFGAAITVGNFDNDNFDDLAIGVPGETLSSVQSHSGMVHVIYGTAGGLQGTGGDLWTQNSGSIEDVSESNDRFGAALASGDFDGDTFDDLAIGVPGESVTTITRAGVAHVIYGSGLGLGPIGNQLWHQNIAGIEENSEIGDEFGLALDAGDFNNDGRDDLVVGVPGESLSETRSGAINVIYGAPAGLVIAGDQVLLQDTPGIGEISEPNDLFGFALAVGDFDGDGIDDVAVGVPGESVGTTTRAGCVNVLYGSGSGLLAGGNQVWSQATGGMKDSAEQADAFGQALCSGDFDGDGFADLAVGIPFENVGAQTDAGAMHIIYGSNGGLSATDNQFIHQNTQNVEGVAKPGDLFGGQRLDLF